MVQAYIEKGTDYPGVCVFLQNILIFISSLVFKFGRGDNDGWSSW